MKADLTSRWVMISFFYSAKNKMTSVETSKSN